MVINMLYLNEIAWDLTIAGIAIAFVLINLLIGIIKYKKIKHNKTAGTSDTLVKLKLNQDIKVNNYDLGMHIYADKEKDKWVLIIDNPKSCDIYTFNALEDYVLTVNGEYVVRSSMKNLISKIESNFINSITLDIFCINNKKYRFQFLNKECKLNDNVFQLHYGSAVKFCDILEYILENKKGR